MCVCVVVIVVVWGGCFVLFVKVFGWFVIKLFGLAPFLPSKEISLLLSPPNIQMHFHFFLSSFLLSLCVCEWA